MSLYLACGLTMAIETVYFWLAGFRKREFLTVCLAINVATNLTMNLILRATGVQVWIVILSEIIVVTAEYTVYCFVAKATKKLLLHTVIANVLSFLAGGLILKSLMG